MRNDEVFRLLDVCCRASGCSRKALLGGCRRWPLMAARYAFFVLAMEHGLRQYEAAWWLNRSKNVSFHYRKTAAALLESDAGFRSLVAKVRERYENG